eukprot:6253782-Alexandrium_andersonii.AAC.1
MAGGDFVRAARQKGGRGFGIPPIVVVWGCNELDETSPQKGFPLQANLRAVFPPYMTARLH